MYGSSKYECNKFELPTLSVTCTAIMLKSTNESILNDASHLAS